jgi:hypothetical protein
MIQILQMKNVDCRIIDTSKEAIDDDSNVICLNASLVS